MNIKKRLYVLTICSVDASISNYSNVYNHLPFVQQQVVAQSFGTVLTQAHGLGRNTLFMNADTATADNKVPRDA
jgi:hypothetical protein